jgi:hypothetical protein
MNEILSNTGAKGSLIEPVATNSFREMISRAIQTGAAADMVERLMAAEERWEARNSRKAFDEAIANARAEIGPISKNRKVDFTSAKGRTNYVYEDLAGIEAAIVPALSKYGLSYRFRTTVTPERPDIVIVTCRLAHRDGHSEENSLPGPLDTSGNKNAIQAIGSTVTYLQRYTLKAALGLAASIDDDGQAGFTAPATINDAQVEELVALLDDAGCESEDIAKFCSTFRIQGLADLPASKMGEARTRIANHKAKRAANATGQA